MKTAILVIGVIILIAGCTNARISANLTSGVIGCSPEDITIEKETGEWITGLHAWEAVCNGKRYVCSYQNTTGINCKEKVK